tara:strand:- start:3770 stop:3997 length:228 start_codon:yes stop_codon:yes gene_type:complete
MMRNLRLSNKNETSFLIYKNDSMLNKMEDLANMYDEQFDVTWDDNDMIQVPEDEWISSVIGTDEDAIYDVLAEIN